MSETEKRCGNCKDCAHWSDEHPNSPGHRICWKLTESGHVATVESTATLQTTAPEFGCVLWEEISCRASREGAVFVIRIGTETEWFSEAQMRIVTLLADACGYKGPEEYVDWLRTECLLEPNECVTDLREATMIEVANELVSKQAASELDYCIETDGIRSAVELVMAHSKGDMSAHELEQMGRAWTAANEGDLATARALMVALGTSP